VNWESEMDDVDISDAWHGVAMILPRVPEFRSMPWMSWILFSQRVAMDEVRTRRNSKLYTPVLYLVMLYALLSTRASTASISEEMQFNPQIDVMANLGPRFVGARPQTRPETQASANISCVVDVDKKPRSRQQRSSAVTRDARTTKNKRPDPPAC
jgi:hypothetical protein